MRRACALLDRRCAGGCTTCTACSMLQDSGAASTQRSCQLESLPGVRLASWSHLLLLGARTANSAPAVGLWVLMGWLRTWGEIGQANTAWGHDPLETICHACAACTLPRTLRLCRWGPAHWGPSCYPFMPLLTYIGLTATESNCACMHA